ncbi:MAG: DUF523 and DUF1722 domain-containing protein [Pseudomonadota bacterium]
MNKITYIEELSASTSWPRPRLGISRCLLGHKVRFDGGHKRDAWIMNELSKYVDFQPLCPEVECGMGIPREALRLVGDAKNPEKARLMTSRSGEDWTDTMLLWSATRLQELEEGMLCGYIFKRASPSNGMERVKVYPVQADMTQNNEDKASKTTSARTQTVPQNKGIGIFARAFMEHFPSIPVEEEGRLRDLTLRERFIERIFIMQRWYDCINTVQASGAKGLYAKSHALGLLVTFHTRHKLLVLSHSPSHYRAMGRLVANAKHHEIQHIISDYEKLLRDALSIHATHAKHCNVMQSMMGHFKNQLSPREKGELLEYIIMYRNKEIPLIVPMTLFIHYIRKYEEDYLAMQYYINPYPMQLHLRNNM